MPAINLPFNIQVGQALDPSEVMANYQSITNVSNGALEADANIQVAAPNSQPGTVNNEGVAATLMRSDASFVIQGVENLAADPTTGNVLGRVYWNTVSKEFRACTDITGSGTYLSIGPLTPATAAELVVHAPQHKDGGHDPLADNTLTDHMKAARTIYTATLGSDITSLSTTAFTTVLDLSVTTTNAQTVMVTLAVNLDAGSAGGTRTFFLRMVDHTASDVTIWRSEQTVLAAGANLFYTATFPYTTPSAGGARTLRLAAGVDTNTNVNILKPVGHHTDSTTIPNLSAVII